MKKLTKAQIEKITAYAKDHFTVEKDAQWSDSWDVLMDGCFITLAHKEFENEDYAYNIPVGDPKLELAFEPDGEIMFLVEKEISKVEAYRDFDKASNSSVACIGFSEKNQSWTGWSHRACCSFKIGDEIKEGDLAASSGWLPEYEKEHPERCFNLKPGFKCETLDDCRKAAIAYAMAVA